MSFRPPFEFKPLFHLKVRLILLDPLSRKMSLLKNTATPQHCSSWSEIIKTNRKLDAEALKDTLQKILARQNCVFSLS